ncbi:homoserine dehydrogenase, partial [Aminobacter sp. Piv2-1]
MTINVAPVGLARELIERQKSGKPIRIGLIGSGEMGTDIVARVAHMPGIEVGAISELNLPNAHRAVDIAYQEKGHAREVGTGSDLNAAIEAGKVAVTNDADLILDSGLIDV